MKIDLNYGWKIKCMHLYYLAIHLFLVAGKGYSTWLQIYFFHGFKYIHHCWKFILGSKKNIYWGCMQIFFLSNDFMSCLLSVLVQQSIMITIIKYIIQFWKGSTFLFFFVAGFSHSFQGKKGLLRITSWKVVSISLASWSMYCVVDCLPSYPPTALTMSVICQGTKLCSDVHFVTKHICLINLLEL